MKIFQKIALLTCVIAVTACTSSFRSTVATFHEIGTPGNERVMLVPMNAEKKDSLEFRQYAGALAAHLKNNGYIEAGDKKPELIAGFDVSISDGREKLRNKAVPFSHHYWDSYWTWGRYWGLPYHHPFSDHDTQIVAGTVYTATLTLELRKPGGELIFEGRAETETRSKTLPEVVPFLAEALFQSFPGESGVTRKVVIEPVEGD